MASVPCTSCAARASTRAARGVVLPVEPVVLPVEPVVVLVPEVSPDPPAPPAPAMDLSEVSAHPRLPMPKSATSDSPLKYLILIKKYLRAPDYASNRAAVGHCYACLT